MRAHFPEKPYTITKDMWDEYYEVQESGIMNMMGHHLIGYFFSDNAWQKSFNHFEKDANTADLVIE